MYPCMSTNPPQASLPAGKLSFVGAITGQSYLQVCICCNGLVAVSVVHVPSCSIMQHGDQQSMKSVLIFMLSLV